MIIFIFMRIDQSNSTFHIFDRFMIDRLVFIPGRQMNKRSHFADRANFKNRFRKKAICN